ncbi:hypothetical protein JL720_12759 [Aureococcus anophagefferens]|nr:hypothetical protein JL720_12759 [Aureococcus anophagefferens]
MRRRLALLAGLVQAASAATVASDILFVSAQPDEPEFIWQCEAYGANFRSLGVAPHRVAMVFAVARGRPASEGLASLQAMGYRVEPFEDARGAAYRAYTGTVRLHAMARFFDRYAAELATTRVFYHDADVAFLRLPEILAGDGSCLPRAAPRLALSDAGAYVGFGHVERTARAMERSYPGAYDACWAAMCGAFPGQGLLEGVDAAFFAEALERTADLFNRLRAFEAERPHVEPMPFFDTQLSWKADMFAPLWLLWSEQPAATTATSPDLSFGWATDSRAEASTHAILHMAGVAEPARGVFHKGSFKNESPVDRLCADAGAFDDVDADSASALYVERALDVAVSLRPESAGCAKRAARDVLFVSVMPDIPFLRWQCAVYLRNFLDVGVRPKQVVMLFALKRGEEESKAVSQFRNAGARSRTYVDARPKTAAFEYTGSIRLWLLAKFVADDAAELRAHRVFYHDADVIFPRGLPPLLANPPSHETRPGVKPPGHVTTILADATAYTGTGHIQRSHDGYAAHGVDVWGLLCAAADWERDTCVSVVRARDGEGTGIFSQGLLYDLWDADFFHAAWEVGDAMYKKIRKEEKRLHLGSWGANSAVDVQLSFKADMLAPLWLLWKADAAGEARVDSSLSDEFAFAWATSPRSALDRSPILHMAGAWKRCGDTGTGARASTCGFFKNEWVLRSPVNALCEDPAEFDYVTDDAASVEYVAVFKRLVDVGLPNGVDACDPLYAGEPAYCRARRGDGAVVAATSASRPEPASTPGDCADLCPHLASG